jgi:hypothetical protein
MVDQKIIFIDRGPEVTDLSDVPVTEVKITKPQYDAAVDMFARADKSAKYGKWLKGQVEAVISGELADNPVLAMVCMLISYAKEHPGGNFHRVCTKRGLLDVLDGCDSYVPGNTN